MIHTDFHCCIENQPAGNHCPVESLPAVSQPPVGVSSIDDELEQLIEDLHWHYRTAYDRFERHRLPTDRDDALLWLHRMNAAILARSPAAQAARHAAFERELEERVSYFTSAHARELGRVGGA